ncbi:MAG: adenylosuccinate synthase [Acidobacteriota bacterium]
MSNIVIVGTQWGDEGKGKIVDLIGPSFSAVARYQGGHNAGHTVRFGDEHYALHLIPSGILHAGTRCFLGNGMVISPEAFLGELDGLLEKGIEADGRLFISDRAQLLVPIHGHLDKARESAAGKDKIGTTARGIGPTYEMKISRYGLRMGDLGGDLLARRLGSQLGRIEGELRHLGIDFDSAFDDTMSVLEEAARRLEPYITDVSLALSRAIDEGQSILFEGAQGTLLDIDHGTYPFVTSSNSTAGGACTGTGVPPTAITGVLGILKAYTTRVGEGPFPTELHDASGEHLGRVGNEFGTTTGRPRRCGWLDLVIGRYAARINGLGSIALTKLDVLDELEEIPVCVGYEIDGQRVDDFPSDLGRLERATPVYETLPGWGQSTVGILREEDLPENARRYVSFIEESLGVPVDLISTGPRREETILTGKALADWLGSDYEKVVAARDELVAAS